MLGLAAATSRASLHRRQPSVVVRLRRGRGLCLFNRAAPRAARRTPSRRSSAAPTRAAGVYQQANWCSVDLSDGRPCLLKRCCRHHRAHRNRSDLEGVVGTGTIPMTPLGRRTCGRPSARRPMSTLSVTAASTPSKSSRSTSATDTQSRAPELCRAGCSQASRTQRPISSFLGFEIIRFCVSGAWSAPRVDQSRASCGASNLYRDSRSALSTHCVFHKGLRCHHETQLSGLFTTSARPPGSAAR
jgi:hypothetical protein